jgi:Fusaric acid resistance protein-like
MGTAMSLASYPARQLTLVRRRTQPIAVYIARLTATATFAYLLALHVPAGTSRPVLAPLTALLVLQASLFQTIRSGIRKVISVTVGVLVAVGVSAFVDFNWWLLGLLIAGALLLGHLLRLGDDLLEVPISAMLIFSSIGAHDAASGRVVDTLVGTVAGLAGGLLFAPLQVQPAREAVGELAGRLADLLGQLAASLAAEPDPARLSEWLDKARALRGDIERVDDTLRQAEDSARLNPRTLRVQETLPETETALRGGLETLEIDALTIRFLARSLFDATRVPSGASPVRDPETRARLAALLNHLAAAIRTYGRLVATMPAGDKSLESALTAQLEAAHRQQDALADLLEPHATQDGEASEWPLRGEILSHVDRLRTGLRADEIPRQRRPHRRRRRVTMSSAWRALPGHSPKRHHRIRALRAYRRHPARNRRPAGTPR